MPENERTDARSHICFDMHNFSDLGLFFFFFFFAMDE
jgi:hypothetical protein